VVNTDLLHWFDEDETSQCPACRARACVTAPKALAAFCLHCGAVWIDGERLDVDGKILA